MASWPRAIVPFEVTSLEMPGPLISKSQSGRVNLRTTQQIGRTWTERYLVNVRSVNGRALLAFVDNVWRNGSTFTIDHRDHLTPLGTGGGSPLVNSAPNLITDPENFAAWSVTGTPILTSAQLDPFGGTGAYLINDDDAAANENVYEPLVFTGNATKAFAVYMRVGSASSSGLIVRDETAGAVQRHNIVVTWTAGVPSMVTNFGSGTLYNVVTIGSGWYRLEFTADGIIAANNNRLIIYPAGAVASATGTVYVFGANAWNELTPTRYSGPSATGTAQTGSNVYVNGGTASTANWLRAGDVFRMAGLNPAYEVTADTSTQANGYAVLPINPPIFTGGSPADNAALTITGVTLTACILEPPTYPTTSGPSADYGELQIKFSESL